jgi:hypothetical protein
MTLADINSLQDLLELFDQEGVANERHAHVRFWFRGQPQFGWELRPGVYRPRFKATTEEQRLNIEQHLTQDFRIQSSDLRRGRDNRAEIYFLQQHYRMPTRLLDWTTSPLAALHFAVSRDPSTDAQLFWMDAYRLAIKQGVSEKVFRGVGSQRNDRFLGALQPIFEFGKVTDFPNYIIPIRPDYMDARINAQSSCFTFHVPSRPTLTTKENDTLKSLKIPAASKMRIQKELFLLGVDDFFIFRDLEGLSSRLCAAHLS